MPDIPTLAEIVAALKDHVQSGAGPWCRDCSGDWPCRFAALLARISTDAELFDVERLARALHCQGTCWYDCSGPTDERHLRRAAAILAALAPETPTA